MLLEQHRAARRGIQPAENVEKRRFPASGGTEQHEQLSAVEIQVKRAKRLHDDVAGSIDLGEPPREEHPSEVDAAMFGVGQGRRLWGKAGIHASAYEWTGDGAVGCCLIRSRSCAANRTQGTRSGHSVERANATTIHQRAILRGIPAL